jgi:hypothetical protein
VKRYMLITDGDFVYSDIHDTPEAAEKRVEEAKDDGCDTIELVEVTVVKTYTKKVNYEEG